MVRTGLDILKDGIPHELHGKRVGVLCHSASVTHFNEHIIDVLSDSTDVIIGAIFSTEQSLFGVAPQEELNESYVRHPMYDIPVYEVSSANPRPPIVVLEELDALIIDLQDCGARQSTELWIMKAFLETCAENTLHVWILDRPNPIAAITFDGPLLYPDFFSCVGGLEIPVCHRLTIAELALLIKETFFQDLELTILWMENWHRNSLMSETGLPWILSAFHIPTFTTTILYPGMILLEATNISEAKGTPLPYELFGAPFLSVDRLYKNLFERRLPGCIFRKLTFTPTTDKWLDHLIPGMQIHVTNPRTFKPVYTALSVIDAIIQTSQRGGFAFKNPPYACEKKKMPFDILAGSDRLRLWLTQGGNCGQEYIQWLEEWESYVSIFTEISHYPEEL